MISTKYAADYRMETEMVNGKIKSRMVYTGPLYRWNLSEQERKKLSLQYFFLGVAEWMVFIGSMLFYSTVSKRWYVVLPYGCLALVLGFLISAAWRLYRAEQPMHRVIKEKTYDRIKGAYVAGMVLCIGTAIGEVTAYVHFIEWVGAEDLLFITANILLFLLFLYGFKESRQLMVFEEAHQAVSHK